MKTPILTLAAGALAITLSACSSTGGSRSPDEFRVVTKAPLTVPPEYKLRPPVAGNALPAEVDEKRADIATAFGTNIGKNASASEKELVRLAGANAVSPMVRNQVDYDETKTIRKSSSVADKVLFWRKGENGDGPVEDNATGNGEVTIERSDAKPRLKLPGT